MDRRGLLLAIASVAMPRDRPIAAVPLDTSTYGAA
jgi:hypothetical protein